MASNTGIKPFFSLGARIKKEKTLIIAFGKGAGLID